MQTEMSRGPLAEDDHSKKGTVGGGLRPTPNIPFLPWSSSAFPLACLSAFTHGRPLQLFYIYFTIFVDLQSFHSILLQIGL